MKPAYVLGGANKKESLRKVDCQVHLSILRELVSPE
ncbi:MULTISPECIES: T6SS immunity protein Tdi1 domain-containing protein [unclassified Enterobacter cloacae complex]|nr:MULTISPECIES: T6SS immunity protein Tdi1 domain-containing protein [unclassified Enterobacter cloacae complex]